jgi:hypothetical protein
MASIKRKFQAFGCGAIELFASESEAITPMLLCKARYNKFHTMALAGDIVSIFDPADLFGKDGPLESLRSVYEVAATAQEAASEVKEAGDIIDRIKGWWDKVNLKHAFTETAGAVLDFASVTLAKAGDAALKVAFLGIPQIAQAVHSAITGAVEIDIRACLACHVAYIVRMQPQFPQGTPADQIMARLQELEKEPLPVALGEFPNCPPGLQLKQRLEGDTGEWLTRSLATLTVANTIDAPLRTALNKVFHDADTTDFLRAAQVVSPVIVRMLTSPVCWKE